MNVISPYADIPVTFCPECGRGLIGEGVGRTMSFFCAGAHAPKNANPCGGGQFDRYDIEGELALNVRWLSSASIPEDLLFATEQGAEDDSALADMQEAFGNTLRRIFFRKSEEESEEEEEEE